MITDIKEGVIQVVNSIIESELNSENMHDDLVQVGIDSIRFIQIVVSIEEFFRIEIPDEKLLLTQMGTLSQIVDVVATALEND